MEGCSGQGHSGFQSVSVYVCGLGGGGGGGGGRRKVLEGHL